MNPEQARALVAFVSPTEKQWRFSYVKMEYAAVETDAGRVGVETRLMDEKLADITICDPAVGSGAFPVGMMTEIVRARSSLTPYFNDVHDRTLYHFKRHAIQNCLYGVDVDPGAVEIAKLRLWLSLVVDEEDVKQIKPLPNLFYKIVTGNSLLGVEKNLFNQQLFQQLEKLKPLYFDQTDAREKERLRRQIDDLIHKLTNGKEAFDFEIYFSEVFHRKEGFDVVIGNPPYVSRNALQNQSPEVAKVLRSNYETANGRDFDLFGCFIERGVGVLKTQGTLTQIVASETFRTFSAASRLFNSQTKQPIPSSSRRLTGQSADICWNAGRCALSDSMTRLLNPNRSVTSPSREFSCVS